MYFLYHCNSCVRNQVFTLLLLCSGWFYRSNENPVKTSEMEIVNGLQHFCKKNYYLNTSQVDTDTMFLIRKLSNQLFANYLFPINTILEPIKQMYFKSYFKFLSIFNVSEAYSEFYQTLEMDCFVKIVNNLKPLNIFLKYSISDV